MDWKDPSGQRCHTPRALWARWGLRTAHLGDTASSWHFRLQTLPSELQRSRASFAAALQTNPTVDLAASPMAGLQGSSAFWCLTLLVARGHTCHAPGAQPHVGSGDEWRNGVGLAFLLGPWLGVPLGRTLLEVGTEGSKFSQVLAFRSPAYLLEVWAAWLGLTVPQWGLGPPRVDLH